MLQVQTLCACTKIYIQHKYMCIVSCRLHCKSLWGLVPTHNHGRALLVKSCRANVWWHKKINSLLEAPKHPAAAMVKLQPRVTELCTYFLPLQNLYCNKITTIMSTLSLYRTWWAGPISELSHCNSYMYLICWVQRPQSLVVYTVHLLKRKF